MSATNNSTPFQQKDGVLAVFLLLAAYAVRGGKLPLPFFVVFAAIAGCFILTGKHRSLVIPKDTWPWIAFLAWYLIPRPFSPPFEHLYKFAHVVCCFLFGVYFARSSEKTADLFGRAVGILAIVEAISITWAPQQNFNLGGWLTGNPNYSGLLIASGALYFTVVGVSGEESHRRKALAFAGAAFLSASLLIMRTRGSLFALIIALLWLLFVLKKYPLQTLAVLTIAFLILARYGNLVGYFKINIDQPEEWLGRIEIWKAGGMALKERWLLGYGWGGFESAYRVHQTPLSSALRYFKTTPFAHNDYLQLAVEGGFPALLLVLAANIRLFRLARNPESNNPSSLWCKSVLILFGVSALFNFSFFLPLNALVFAGCTGVLWGRIPNNAANNWKLSKEFSLAGLVIVSLLIVFTGTNAVADVVARKKSKVLAAKIMPFNSLLWYDAAVGELEKLEIAENPTERDQARANAVDYVKRAIKVNGSDPFLWSRLALMQERFKLGEAHDMQRSFEKAIELAPHHAPFYLDEAFYWYRSKEYDTAKKYFMKGLALEPNTSLPYFGLGIVYLKSNPRAAEAMAHKALEMNARYSSFYLGSSPYADFLYSSDNKRLENLIRIARSKR